MLKRIVTHGIVSFVIHVLLAVGVAGAAWGETGISGHQLGLREQWQPQTESDARLNQPVQAEWVEQDLVTLLAGLTKQTGVTLQVAPEDAKALGERKLTIIAQGCSLKALLVQIPNALQDCHWDVQPDGATITYFLHRDAGADERELAELIAHANDPVACARAKEQERRGREDRVQAGRDALAMSPQQLANLAKEDPLMAAAAKDAATRKQMELFLSLPDDSMRGFLANGALTSSYTSAPDRFQQACRDILQQHLEAGKLEGGWQKTMADAFTYALGNPSSITFSYYGGGDAMGSSYGYWLGVNITDQNGRYIGVAAGEQDRGDAGSPALPPALPDEYSAGRSRALLVRAGIADEETARTIVAGLVAKRNQPALEARDRARALDWREPTGPELHQTVTLPFTDETSVPDMLRYIAKQSGLSIIADGTNFGSEPRHIDEKAKEAMPMWRLLYLLRESKFWWYAWDKAGGCLVFRTRMW
jgi:hypothetical protein